MSPAAYDCPLCGHTMNLIGDEPAPEMAFAARFFVPQVKVHEGGRLASDKSQGIVAFARQCERCGNVQFFNAAFIEGRPEA